MTSRDSSPPVAARPLNTRRILAVFNPAAGGNRRARFERIMQALRKEGCSVTTQHTTRPGHATEIARNVDTSAFDIIAAAGGDGTINEVINGLHGKDIALGLIPLGTANVLADETGVGHKPENIVAALARGPIREIRVGVANGRRFSLMAGVGFDANVVHGVSLSLKKKIGPLAYVVQAAREAFGGAFTPCRVVIDGKTYTPTSVVICNGQRYGGPFIAAPNASIMKDEFAVILMNGRGWFSVLKYGVGLALGKLGNFSDVEIITAREIVVEGTGQPVQADGDIVTTLPVTIQVDPQPVKVVYPAAA
ncbi:MAG: diacylglycerol kinase family lipid kinase [Rhodospirillaceae bacterium]|nr:diacylglycerol kinase family lipid kinase [Rhodospirillaceae bacterium]